MNHVYTIMYIYNRYIYIHVYNNIVKLIMTRYDWQTI